MINLAKDIFKYCPKCGSTRFSAIRETFLHCPECDLNYYINPKAAVAGIIYDEGKILFTIRKNDPCKGMLDLPGGFVDTGENAEEAIRREIKEELNLDVRACKYLTSAPNTYDYKGLCSYVLDLGFAISVESLSTLKVADDVADVSFVRPKDIVFEELFADSTREITRFFIAMNCEVK